MWTVKVKTEDGDTFEFTTHKKIFQRFLVLYDGAMISWNKYNRILDYMDSLEDNGNSGFNFNPN